jgi:DNA-binding phage protein
MRIGPLQAAFWAEFYCVHFQYAYFLSEVRRRRVHGASLFCLGLMYHAVQAAPRGRKIVQRWTEDEDRTVMRFFMQAMLLAGPRFEFRLLPWGRLPGLYHSSSAAARRIPYYRSLKTSPSFAALTELVVSVYSSRVANARTAVRTAVEDVMRRGTNAVSSTGAPLQLLSLPEAMQRALPRNTLEAAMPREDFRELVEDALFTPRTNAEVVAHEELRNGLRKFLEAVPVARAAHIGGRKQNDNDFEVALVCRPDGQRRRAATAVLRAEVQEARVSGGAQASLRAVADGVGWLQAACVAHLFGLAVAAAAPGAGKLIAAEAPCLVSTFSQGCIRESMECLRRGRLLVLDRTSPLGVALAQQARTMAEAVAGAALSGGTVVGAAEWLKAGLSGEDSSIQTPVDARVSGALVATTLAGICGASLELHATAMDQSGRSGKDSAQLDQFDDRDTWGVRISQAAPGGLHSTVMMETHAAFGGAPAVTALTAAALELSVAARGSPEIAGMRGAPDLQSRTAGARRMIARGIASNGTPSVSGTSSVMHALGLHSAAKRSPVPCATASSMWAGQEEGAAETLTGAEAGSEDSSDATVCRASVALGEAVDARGQEGISVDDLEKASADFQGLREVLSEAGEAACRMRSGCAQTVYMLDANAYGATGALDEGLMRAGWQVRCCPAKVASKAIDLASATQVCSCVKSASRPMHAAWLVGTMCHGMRFQKYIRKGHQDNVYLCGRST